MKIELCMEFFIPPYCFDSKSSDSDTSKGYSPELTDIEAGKRFFVVHALPISVIINIAAKLAVATFMFKPIHQACASSSPVIRKQWVVGSLDQQVMNTAGLVAIAGKSQFVVNAANI